MTDLSVPYTTPTSVNKLGGIYTGAGAPSFKAPKGSLYVNTAATTATTRLYINTDAGTTWANFTASA